MGEDHWNMIECKWLSSPHFNSKDQSQQPSFSSLDHGDHAKKTLEALQNLQRTSLSEVDSIKFIYEKTFILWQTAHRAYWTQKMSLGELQVAGSSVTSAQTVINTTYIVDRWILFVCKYMYQQLYIYIYIYIYIFIYLFMEKKKEKHGTHMTSLLDG